MEDVAYLLECIQHISSFGDRLAPGEAKVAARMADGMTADQIGNAHGTSGATVRTQVREVLHKPGAKRSVDVVRLLRQVQPLWTE